MSETYIVDKKREGWVRSWRDADKKVFIPYYVLIDQFPKEMVERYMDYHDNLLECDLSRMCFYNIHGDSTTVEECLDSIIRACPTCMWPKGMRVEEVKNESNRSNE